MDEEIGQIKSDSAVRVASDIFSEHFHKVNEPAGHSKPFLEDWEILAGNGIDGKF